MNIGSGVYWTGNIRMESMKKLLAVTAVVLAIGCGAIVLDVMNDPMPESQDRVVQVDAVEIAPEAVPEAVPEPVQKAVEPQAAESTIVEERVSIVQEKPYWRKFLDAKIEAGKADVVACIESYGGDNPLLLRNSKMWQHSTDGYKNTNVIEYYTLADRFC